MIPIIVGALGIGLLAAAKGRPSTIIRLAEDTVVGAGRSIARSSKGFVRNVRIEMTARQLAKGQANVEAEDKRYRSMSLAQRKQADEDVRSIVRRASELRASKK